MPLGWFKGVSDDAIMEEAGAWMRYCAVSAYNGTISISGTLSFDMWLLCCRTSWMKRVSDKLRVSVDRIEQAVRNFAQANAGRESELRLALDGTVLAPGESMTVTAKVRL